jgi:hypothetical protein
VRLPPLEDQVRLLPLEDRVRLPSLLDRVRRPPLDDQVRLPSLLDRVLLSLFDRPRQPLVDRQEAQLKELSIEQASRYQTTKDRFPALRSLDRNLHLTVRQMDSFLEVR